MRRILAAAAVAGAMLLNVGATSAQAPMNDRVIIPIQGDQYLVPDLAIRVGTTVEWVNLDPYIHDAMDIAGDRIGTVFDSGPIEPGIPYSFTFTSAGVFPYTCNYHYPQFGTITVYE